MSELLQLLTRAERLLARRLRAVLEQEGRTLDEWRVLSLLSDGNGHHMGEIADFAFLPAPSLTKLMDSLVDANLVYRRVDDLDRRRIRAFLTPRGRQLHGRIDDRVRASWAELGIDDGALIDALRHLVDSLDQSRLTA